MQWVGLKELRSSSGNAIQAGDLIDEATGSLLVKPVNAVCVPVHNATGSPLTAGTLVYINGFYYNSNYPTIAAADNTDPTKQAQFVVLSTIADGTDGYVNGIAMVRFMDTSARTVGDIAYLSTSGSITFTAPTTAGTMQQPVGVVASKSSSGANGDIYFFPSISRETENGAGIDPLSITTGMLAAGAVTNAKLASTAVTESVTVAKTFTHASLSDTAAIVGSQLSATANIAGSQLASNAAIAGSQLASNAAITGSQLSASAGITGGQLAAGVKGNVIGPYEIKYSGLTASKDVISGIPFGFIGSIVKVYGIVSTAAGGSSGVGTLTFTLSTAGILQSAGPAAVTLAIANTDTLYQVTTQSAAPTLQNTFVASDSFKISYAQTTTFGSDTGVIRVYLVTN